MDSLMTAMSMDDNDPPPDEAIAIIGMACGGQNPDLFWDTIRNGRRAVGEVSPDRWGADFYSADRDQSGKTTSRRGSFLPSPLPSGFDAILLIFRRWKLRRCDPQQQQQQQQRRLLEVGRR
jgi:polyketide synthase PksM